MSGREILLTLTVKYNGDWDKIYDAIKRKEQITESDINSATVSTTSQWVTLVDSDYPESLKAVYKPPFVLFYQGDIRALQNQDILSVVGYQKSTAYSIKNTCRIVNELKGQKTILTQLESNLGQETINSALKNDQSIIVFSTAGLNTTELLKKHNLINEIIKQGLILSEAPDNTIPNTDNILLSSRLLSGLASGCLFGEIRSNDKFTNAVLASGCQTNKDIFIVPQPIDTSAINNHIIAMGANLVENGDDICDK